MGTKIRYVATCSWGLGEGLTAKLQERSFGDDENVIYLDENGNFMSVYRCQYPLIYILNEFSFLNGLFLIKPIWKNIFIHTTNFYSVLLP